MRKTLLLILALGAFGGELILYKNWTAVKERIQTDSKGCFFLSDSLLPHTLYLPGFNGDVTVGEPKRKVVERLKDYIGKEIYYKSGKEWKRGVLAGVEPIVVKDGFYMFDLSWRDIGLHEYEPFKKGYEVCVKRPLRDQEIFYAIRGIDAKVLYHMELDSKLHISGKIEIFNATDRNFDNFYVVYVSSKDSGPSPLKRVAAAMPKAVDGADFIKAEGSYLVRLENERDIPKNSRVFLGFMDSSFEYLRSYEIVTSGIYGRFPERKEPFDLYISFRPNKVLPGGRAIFYSGGTVVSQTYLPETAKKERVKLRISKEYDLILHKKQLSYKRDKKRLDTRIEYKIENLSENVRHYNIFERLNPTDAEIFVECEKCKYGAVDAYTYKISGEIGARQEITVRASYSLPLNR